MIRIQKTSERSDRPASKNCAGPLNVTVRKPGNRIARSGSSIILREDVVLSTRSPTHVDVVAGGSAVGNLNVVSGGLVPSNHLLSTLGALGRVTAAPGRGLGLSKLLGRGGVCDMAPVVGHVHVGLATAVRHPEPGTVAAASRASREILGDIVGGDALPRSAVAWVSRQARSAGE